MIAFETKPQSVEDYLKGGSMHFAPICIVFLGLVALASLMWPSDAIGIWVRIIAVGYLSGVMVGIGFIFRDIIRHQPVDWSRFHMIVAICTLACALIYAIAAWRTETVLQQEINRTNSLVGCLEVHLIGRDPFIVCPEDAAPESSVRLRVVRTGELPDTLLYALRAAEDVRQEHGVTFSDAHGVVRAVESKGRTGGSGACQQTSRLLLHVSHFGTTFERSTGKAKVWLSCFVLDGMRTRRAQMEMYADLVDLGSVGSTTIQGVGAAARVFFNKDVASLTLSEAYTIAALVKNPGIDFPLLRPGEPVQSAVIRRSRLHDRFDAVIDNAIRYGFLTSAQADEARQSFGSSFVDTVQLQTLLPPSIHAVRIAVALHVLDSPMRYLRVDSAYSPEIEAATLAGVNAGLAKVRPMLGPQQRAGLKADAAILNEAGQEMATVNLVNAVSDVGSIHKLEEYAYGRSQRCLRSMQQPILGISADTALAESIPKAAYALVDCLGCHQYAEFLATQGFRVTNPALVVPSGCDSIASGSGVGATPLQVAAIMRMFSPTDQPGVYIDPDFTSQIADAATGQVIYRPGSRVVFTPEIAREVSTALRLTARIGTTRNALGSIALQNSAIRSKTGTAHFMKNGRLRGGGGAWLAASDGKFVIAVRVTLTGEEIPLDGGVAGGLVAREVFTQLQRLRTAPAQGESK